MASEHLRSTWHRAVAAEARRRPRPLRIKQIAPNIEGAEAVAIAHPSCTSNSSGTDVFGEKYRRKGREVGAVRCHDLRTQAPQFLASARVKHVEPERMETLSSIGAEACPAQRSSQAAKAAERWLGGGAAFGRLRTARRHGGCTSLPPRQASVAAATIPL